MKSHHRTASAAGHAVGMIAEAALICAILALLALVLAPFVRPAASLAGVQTTSASSRDSSVWIESSSGTRVSGGDVQFGQGFRVGYATRERKPWAHATCFPSVSTVFDHAYGDGSIWGMYFSVYSGGPQDQAFVAGESVDGNWSSGGASCRVDLVKFSSDYSRETVLASSRFTVAP